MKSTIKWSLMLTSFAMSGAIAVAQPGNQPPPPPPRNNQPQNAGPQQPPRMTAEERRKETEDKLREMMTNNGVTDTATQDALIAYLSNELETRVPLRRLGVKLQRSLTDKNISDDQVKAMIADYQNAQDLENQNRLKAQADLDAKIHYSQNPRLQGILMLMGVLGDGPPLLAGPRRPEPRDNRPNRVNQNRVNQSVENPETSQKMLAMFDKNGDGKLDDQEKAAMRAYLQQHRGDNQDDDQTQPPPPPPNKNQNNQTDDNDT